MSWSDDKELSSGADAIGRNSIKNIYILEEQREWSLNEMLVELQDSWIYFINYLKINCS